MPDVCVLGSLRCRGSILNQEFMKWLAIVGGAVSFFSLSRIADDLLEAAEVIVESREEGSEMEKVQQKNQADIEDLIKLTSLFTEQEKAVQRRLETVEAALIHQATVNRKLMDKLNRSKRYQQVPADKEHR
jgi:hypothetical protein